ncbi:MAG: chorismate synthase [Verrucomicrobiota bacterium]
MPNTFGHLFRVTTFGESHGAGIGVIVDGCPPRIPISLEAIQFDLDRRRPGQSKIVTQRKEADQAEILSGVYEGLTTGAPIEILVRNQDARSTDYKEMETLYRPSHADYTYDAKYGIRSVQGGGRSSARETIGRVAAGSIAKQVFAQFYPELEIVAYCDQIYHRASLVDPNTVQFEEVESNIVRWPKADEADELVKLIEEVRSQGDSVGGIVGCVVRGIPAGWGEPVFDRLEADLAKAMMSLPATKGFEIGSGFGSVKLRGSEHNDAFYKDESGKIRTRTNRSGGVQGGISNGENLVMRIAFKPTATIAQSQETVSKSGESAEIRARGRHDACVLPRAVPMVEAMARLVLVDHFLRQRAIDWK